MPKDAEQNEKYVLKHRRVLGMEVEGVGRDSIPVSQLTI